MSTYGGNVRAGERVGVSGSQGDGREGGGDGALGGREGGNGGGEERDSAESQLDGTYSDFSPYNPYQNASYCILKMESEPNFIGQQSSVQGSVFSDGLICLRGTHTVKEKNEKNGKNGVTENEIKNSQKDKNTPHSLIPDLGSGSAQHSFGGLGLVSYTDIITHLSCKRTRHNG